MSKNISNTELIKLAKDTVNPVEIDGDWIGDVGSALVSDSGKVYKGVCVDTGSGTGLCAERTAIAQMFTNKEYKVKKIVAVWNNNPEKDLYVLPPCGACRQFMFSSCEDALDIDVVLGGGRTSKLKELYPEHDWPDKEGPLPKDVVS